MTEEEDPEPRRHIQRQSRYLFFAFGVLIALLQIQIISQGHRLDDIERQSAETVELTADAKAEIHRIGAIADRFDEGDPEQAAAVQELFRKVDAIYRATVPEEEQEG